MQPSRLRAASIGIFFLLATAAGLINAAILGPIFSAADLLAATGSAASEIHAATLINTIMAVVIVAIAVGIYPVLARTSQTMALGYLVARLAEGIILVIAGALWLVLLPDMAGSAETAGTILSLSVILFGIGAQIVFGLTAMILNLAVLRSGLVPKIISAWGLIGGFLILVFGICKILGADVAHLEPYFAGPIALNELVLAVWLIAKGFRN